METWVVVRDGASKRVWVLVLTEHGCDRERHAQRIEATLGNEVEQLCHVHHFQALRQCIPLFHPEPGHTLYDEFARAR